MYWLLIFIILIPAIEISIFILVGTKIGIWSVLAIIILSGLVGMLFVKQEGLKTWEKIQISIRQNIPPTDEIVDGLCIIIGGLFLITPGFFTDVLGFLFVIPWTRPLFKHIILVLAIKKLSNGQIIYRRW